MTKVILIQPPFRDFYLNWERTYPLGLAYLASNLDENKYDVKILPAYKKKSKKLETPQLFKYLDNYYLKEDCSPICLYKNYKHFGLSYEEIGKTIREINPDVVGISSMFVAYMNEAYEVAKLVKDVSSDIVTIIGGAAVNACPQYFNKEEIDFVIGGEGEERFQTLLNLIVSNQAGKIAVLDGFGFKRNKKFYWNKPVSFVSDLDRLKYPLRRKEWIKNYNDSVQIITSRGCPKKCSFCSVSLSMGCGYRSRTPENILNEIKEIYNRLQVKKIDFEDDNIALDINRFNRLLDLIIEKFGTKKLSLTAQNGFPIENITEKIIEKMAQAGFECVNLTLVSSRDKTTKNLGRTLNYNEYIDKIRLFTKYGIRTISYIFAGFPTQTKEELVDSLVALSKENTFIAPSFFYPIPATPIFEKISDNKIRYEKIRSSALVSYSKKLNALDLVTFFRLVRFVNYIKKLFEKQEKDSLTTDIITDKKLYGINKNGEKFELKISKTILNYYFNK